MKHGKLEEVNQEMARVNVYILGISELKWTGMGEFNSDDHYIYYCGQESLRRSQGRWDPDSLRPALSLGGQATAWEGSPGFLPGEFHRQRILVGAVHEVAKSQT